MRIPRVQLVALLIVTLIFSAVQCLASCAAESCSPAVPPCHQHSTPHHETSNACSHDFVLPLIHAVAIEPVSLVITIESSLVIEVGVTSPPDRSLSSPRILRI